MRKFWGWIIIISCCLMILMWLYNIYLMLQITERYRSMDINQIAFEIVPIIFWLIICTWGIFKGTEMIKPVITFEDDV